MKIIHDPQCLYIACITCLGWHLVVKIGMNNILFCSETSSTPGRGFQLLEYPQENLAQFKSSFKYILNVETWLTHTDSHWKHEPWPNGPSTDSNLNCHHRTIRQSKLETNPSPAPSGLQTKSVNNKTSFFLSYCLRWSSPSLTNIAQTSGFLHLCHCSWQHLPAG